MPWDRLAKPLEQAEQAVIRLDEQLGGHHRLADGWIARQHFHEACAAMEVLGKRVHLDELVLHDALMDPRTPSEELSQAMTILRGRRLAARHGAAWARSSEGLDQLRKRIAGDHVNGAEDLLGLVDSDEPQAAERWARWRHVVDAGRELPALLAAAVAYDAWLNLQPVPRAPWLGTLLIASELQRRRTTRYHLLSLHVGLCGQPPIQGRGTSAAVRIARILDALAAAGEKGTKELGRLAFGRVLFNTKLHYRRRSSSLPDLAQLLLTHPLVTIPMAAKQLGISQQAASKLMRTLSGTARELTGRRRCRAWAVL